MDLRFGAPTKKDNYARIFYPEGTAGLGALVADFNADGLDRRVRDDILQKGLKAAADVVRDDAKRNVRVKTGDLKRNIKSLRPRRRVRGGNQYAREYAEVRVSSRIWYIIEHGRKAGKTDAGRSYGSAPPYPYLRPALENTRPKQFDECTKALRIAYAKAVRDSRRGTG